MWPFFQNLLNASQDQTVNNPAQPENELLFNDDPELAAAIEASLYDSKDEEQRNDHPFNKIVQLLELIGSDQRLIESLSSQFDDYAQECPNNTRTLRTGKTIDEFTLAFVDLPDHYQERLKNYILTSMNTSGFTYINKINIFLDLFNLNADLHDFVSKLSERRFTPSSISAASSSSSPSSSSSSSSSPVLEPKKVKVSDTFTTAEKAQINHLKMRIRNYIAFSPLKDQKDRVIAKLKDETDYRNLTHFSDRLDALKDQYTLLDKMVKNVDVSHKREVESRPHDADRTSSPNPKRRRNS